MAENNDEQQQTEFAMSTMRHKKRLKSQVQLPSTTLIIRQLPGGNATIAPVRKRRTASEQINRHDRVMQLNTSPILATAAAPALHKDSWQQRRYNFLSKYSMFGGELKDDVADQIGVNEQGSDVEQRPIIPILQNFTSDSMDSEALNAKRGSIFGMAVTGVRNLLSDEEEQADEPSIDLKNIILTNKSNQQDLTTTEPIGVNEHDHVDTDVCTKSIQTDDDRVSTPIIATSRTNASMNRRQSHSN
ncbi:unnamed protein product [Rotaria sp. Silwood2]|nr:unnamed protein product [Rotaria sp. Silwood2]